MLLPNPDDPLHPLKLPTPQDATWTYYSREEQEYFLETQKLFDGILQHGWTFPSQLQADLGILAEEEPMPYEGPAFQITDAAPAREWFDTAVGDWPAQPWLPTDFDEWCLRSMGIDPL